MDDILTRDGDDGVLLLRLHGELDLVYADALRSALSDVLLDRDTFAVVLDFEGVTFLDCSAINIILAFARDCARARIGLLVTGLSALYRELLSILGLDGALSVAAGPVEAMVLARLWDGGPPAAPASALLPARLSIPRPAGDHHDG